MPVYEYRCGQCSKSFEATQSVHARPEDTECPFCQAQDATRLLSSFASTVKGDHKPGFAEMKAGSMLNERMVQEERIDDEDRIERYMRLFDKDDVKKLETGVKVVIEKDEWILVP